MSTQHSYDISQYRNKIDEIDQQIYKLLEDRINVIHQVKSIKQQHVKQGSSIRPARAIEVIRNAYQYLSYLYPKHTIVRIWRTLISISEYNEQPFSIIAFNRNCYWLGKEFFGDEINYRVDNNIESLVNYLNKNDNHFGILPFPRYDSDQKWWVYLINSKFKVWSILPLYSSSNTALAIGQVMLEATYKNDYTLIATHKLDEFEKIEGYKIIDVQNKMQCINLYLVQVNKFLNDNQVHYIGGYLIGTYSIV